MINKKIALLLLIFVFHFSAFAQKVASNNKLTLSNRALLNEIQQYQIYLAKFAKDNYEFKYMITVTHEKWMDYDIFRLNAIFYEHEIKRFNPSYVTFVNNKPVLVKTGFEDYVTRDSSLLNDIYTIYWPILTDEEIAHNRYTDSLPKRTNEEYQKKKKKHDADLILQAVDDRGGETIYPREWILTFSADKMIKELIDKNEHSDGSQ